MRRVVVVFVAGALLGLVFAPSADALPLHDFRIAKAADGPFNHLGVRFNNWDKGETRNVHLKVKANTPGPLPAMLKQGTNGGGYKLRFFKGSKNITSQVGGDGYDFVAKPDRAKRFRVNLKVTGDLTDICVEIVLWDQEPVPTSQTRFVANGISPESCI